MRPIRWDCKKGDRIYTISRANPSEKEEPPLILRILTGGKARVPHSLYPLLDMQNALVYSWLCIRIV